jgi:penicillin amidase
MDSTISKVYNDELHGSNAAIPVPEVEPATLMANILKDSASLFADDINTPQHETIKDDITNAFLSIVPVLEKAKNDKVLEWGKFKDGGVPHLLGLSPFSRLHIDAGGGENIINAFEKFHGPSWRMVVELTDDINAYGVYPGGQSGNPGSQYYDDFVNTWAQEKYYPLHLYQKNIIASEKNLLGKYIFSKR